MICYVIRSSNYVIDNEEGMSFLPFPSNFREGIHCISTYYDA